MADQEKIEAALEVRDAWKERIGHETYAKFVEFINKLGGAVEIFTEIGDKLELTEQEKADIEQACGLFEAALEAHGMRATGYSEDVHDSMQRLEEMRPSAFVQQLFKNGFGF